VRRSVGTDSVEARLDEVAHAPPPDLVAVQRHFGERPALWVRTNTT
jgi:hypothetical protein